MMLFFSFIIIAKSKKKKKKENGAHPVLITNIEVSPIDAMVTVRAKLMFLRKLRGDERVDGKMQLLPSRRDNRPQERALFPNAESGELVSANVATLRDQTIEGLVTGSRTV